MINDNSLAQESHWHELNLIPTIVSKNVLDLNSSQKGEDKFSEELTEKNLGKPLGEESLMMKEKVLGGNLRKNKF